MRLNISMRASLLLSLGLLVKAETAVSSTCTKEKNDVKSVPCGIWLAPSTIPGAGLGMFAGRDFEEGEDLQEVGDVVIPVIDMVQHQADDEEYTFLFDEYTWSAVSLGLDHEGKYEVNCVSPGFGSAANSFLPLVNVEEGSPDNDGAGLHRSTDPGAGAFSPYHNRKSMAKKSILAGEEIYVDYGNTWFETRPQLGPCPLYKDLELATKLFRKFQFLQANLPGKPQAFFQEIWESFVQNTTFPESRVIGSFKHDDKEEVVTLKKEDLSDIRRRQSIRTTEWLEEHGTCADHIQAGPSTVQQAGRGAFATRFLPEGTAVAQMPIVHISDRDRLNMYQFGELDEYGERSPEVEAGLRGSQLILNYCMGHAESSLLLCPYGPMTGLLNHARGEKANVKLKWGRKTTGNHMPELLEGSIQELDSDSTAKLAMEIEATRDIEEGEEVFLDYGDEWEAAWNDHVASWKPVDKASTYVSAAALGGNGSERLMTVFEQLQLPFVVPVDLTCNSAFQNKLWKNAYFKGELDSFLENSDGEMFACDIVRYKKVNDVYFYTVILYDEEDEDRKSKIEEIPWEGIKFYDRPYTTDIFLENAFRHDMRIPDDIFPEAWRNRKAE